MQHKCCVDWPKLNAGELRRGLVAKIKKDLGLD